MNINGLEKSKEPGPRVEDLPEAGVLGAALKRRVAEAVPLPREEWPALEELHGDMQVVAELIGVGPALLLAQVFDGTPIRLYGAREWMRRQRDRRIRTDYDTGRYTMIDLARRYDLSDRQISNILGRTE